MRASFFCIGQRARAHPGLVAEIARRGHGVENHTEHHPYRFAALPPAGLRREIAAAQDILAELSGRPPSWFRAPMGLRSPLLQPALENSGLQLASWTRRALDGVSGDAAAALRRLTRGLAAGDVLMMHDGNGRPGPDGRAVVLTVLPPLLRRLRASARAGVRLPNPPDLEVHPRSCRGLTEFSQHQSDGGAPQESERIAVPALPVFGEPTAPVEPGDDPAPG
jgi:peptidoglycan/xylan/chitin deacetylase (PgdA/CDA1 family)